MQLMDHEYETHENFLLETVAWSINLKHKGYLNPSWQSLYRSYAKELQSVSEEHADTAQRLLRTLSLEQTLPFGELDSPEFVDAYTGEFTKPFDPLDLDAEWEDDYDGPAPVAPIDNTREQIIRAYDDKEMRKLALRASAEGVWPMEHDEEFYLEDRGYEPEYLKQDAGPDAELHAAANLIGDTADELHKIIDSRIEVEKGAFGDEWMYRVPFIRSHVQGSLEAIAYLQDLQDLLDTDHNPANVAMLFMRFQHAFAFDPDHAEKVMTKEEDLTGKPLNLREYINDHWDELETWDGVSTEPELSETALAKVADKMLTELLEPIEHFEPKAGPMIRSRAFCDGYIRSIQAGARPIEAYQVGFDTWRSWYCPEANVAFHKIYGKHAWPKPTEDLYDSTEEFHADIGEWAKDNKTAMKKALAIFWTECRKRGLKTPSRPPKKIKSVAARGTGLILGNGRYITWRTAIMIAEAEGFELEQERKERLIELMTKNRWSPKFVQAIA
jgi:hypothetical protein